jgi:hypothetical protein
MLKALGVDNSTKLFELAGAPFVAALLKSLGPDFNALLVTDLGKGAVLLGIDLGASFLAEVGGSSRGLRALRVRQLTKLYCNIAIMHCMSLSEPQTLDRCHEGPACGV